MRLGDGSFVLTGSLADAIIKVSEVILMPGAARKKSKSGIYHVMLRGINCQTIFQDEEDCEKYLSSIEECKAISGFTL